MGKSIQNLNSFSPQPPDSRVFKLFNAKRSPNTILYNNLVDKYKCSKSLFLLCD